MPYLNLGILAHVDAGKTSLSERLLFRAGVIGTLGSVDGGDTRTDSLALERRRGITIRAAVASFPAGDVTVNLIDTPGHPDFIAEVERSLRVLDGAVLVVSAVEGVQAQTRVLMRTLRRLRVPTLIFINKIDRRGARTSLRELATRLTPGIVAMNAVRDAGSAAASVFRPPSADLRPLLVDAVDDPGIMRAYVRDEPALTDEVLIEALARRTCAARAHPAFYGSAMTGAGISDLVDGMVRFLPTATGSPGEPLSARVFKVEDSAFVRVYSGRLSVRDRLGRSVVTAIEDAAGNRRASAGPGEIAKVHGLRSARIGDVLGAGGDTGHQDPLFAPPTFQTVVEPVAAGDRGSLHAALSGLAAQDPFIDLRRDGDDLVISLYGEVQREVLEATLAEDHGIAVRFRDTRVICVERPVGPGTAGATLGEDGNPWLASLDLRVEPGTGVNVGLDVPIEQVPIYLYRTAEFFREALAEAARRSLRVGTHGWPVTDIRITATRVGYTSPRTTAGDFRKLLPLVLGEALRRAGTVVCAPWHRFRIDGPADTLGAVLGCLAAHRAVPDAPATANGEFVVTGEIPAAWLRGVSRALPALTRGEGSLESSFAAYR